MAAVSHAWSVGSVLTAVALLVALPACMAQCDSEPDPAERCAGSSAPPDGAALPARELALGQGTGTAFSPYVDGTTVEVVAGGQGGHMITPVLRLPRLSGDAATSCVFVELRNAIAGADPPIIRGNYLFRADGSAFYSEPINDLLAFSRDEVVGRELLLEATATAAQFRASRSIRLVLR